MLKIRKIHLDTVTSTNDYLKSVSDGDTDTLTVARADFQTKGRGQASNHWESEAGRNLLFSVLIHPLSVPASRQYILSMAGALSICNALSDSVGDITIKWPNDIYWRDKKISGTLIETRLSGSVISDCIFGVGVNVNQQVFYSDAPNPVSLVTITGKETDIDELLDNILQRFVDYLSHIYANDYDAIRDEYQQRLYRGDNNLYLYENHTNRYPSGRFSARIVEVKDDGTLVLQDEDGLLRDYTFKEVSFVI